MENFELRVACRDNVAVLSTEGYINRQAGQSIAKTAHKLIAQGYQSLLLDLAGTKVVNSMGLSAFFGIIEKMTKMEGRLAFCRLTPTLQKTFNTMGLARFAAIYANQEAALEDLLVPERSAGGP